MTWKTSKAKPTSTRPGKHVHRPHICKSWHNQCSSGKVNRWYGNRFGKVPYRVGYSLRALS